MALVEECGSEEDRHVVELDGVEPRHDPGVENTSRVDITPTECHIR